MLDMLRMLQRRGPRGMPVNTVADELGVHRRTVLRYLKALGQSVDNEAGQPIVRRERRDGATWAVVAERAPGALASIYQYAAVFAATRHLTGDSLLSESAAGVLDRLELEGLSPELVARVAAAFHYVPWGPKDYGGDEDVLDALIRGVLNRRPLEVCYRKVGAAEDVVRHLEPWTIVMYRDGLYVLARAEGSGVDARPRLYAVDRIRSAELLRHRRFEVPPGFDPDAFFAGGLGLWQTEAPPERVRLAFRPDAAEVARERRWPGFVSWAQMGDRHVLELQISVTPEVVAWATAWGPGLEVLTPRSLRRAVRDRHAAALAQYEDSAPPTNPGERRSN